MNLPRILYLIATLLAQQVLPYVSADDVAHNSLKVGAAFRVVNPTRPSITIGHRVMERFSNVYADLRVQAMVVEDTAGNRVALMGMDLCILRHEIVDRIKQKIQADYGIKPQSVCINASHTHSAPPMTVEEAVHPEHVDQQYTNRVLDEAVAVVGDAIDRLEPAQVRYALDRCQVGINRRVMRDGKVGFLPNPNGVVDQRVQVLAAESQKTGKLIGVAVKYACHPVTVVGLGIGSDYPGYMREMLEQRHPGTVAVFLQGCGADVRIRVVNEDMTDWVEGNFDRAEQFGKELADAVDLALAKNESPDVIAVNGPVYAAHEEIRLPVEPFDAKVYREAAGINDAFSGNWGRRFTGLIEQGKPIPHTIPYRIQAFHFGTVDSRLTIIALDGEVFTEYGLNLESKLSRGPLIALGYSNGVVTYIPTNQAMIEGGYETTAFRYFLVPGPFRQGTEQQILAAAVRVSHKSLNSPK